MYSLVDLSIYFLLTRSPSQTSFIHVHTWLTGLISHPLDALSISSTLPNFSLGFPWAAPTVFSAWSMFCQFDQWTGRSGSLSA